jgi:stage V sporulation protein D (sporulation-specific penicillin-binding protein)
LKINTVGRIQKIRINILFFLFVLFALVLIGRIGWFQINRGNELANKAIEQQTGDKFVASARGTIYDRNGNTLAASADVERLVATPVQIKTNKNQEVIIDGLSEIISIDKDVILKKITEKSCGVDIKRGIEKNEGDEIRHFIWENKVSGLELVKDTKRYYPYENFASHIMGFVGKDNQGLEGIEKAFDKNLRGKPGRIVSTKNAAGIEMPVRIRKYIRPVDGANIFLTLDEVIQHIVEKFLETAVVENKLNCGAAAIVMDVKTGGILAMATKPDYNPNNPFNITPDIENKIPGIKQELEELKGIEYSKRLTETVSPLWRNKAVVDSYEPGSTFKIATIASALEEQVVKLNEAFFCKGSVKVGPHTMHCWRRKGHGPQTFLTAVQTSCNPVFIEIASRVGSVKFYNYIKGFGFRDVTGIELPGETSGVFFNEKDFKDVQVATTSFGQGFQVTPLQMINFVSAIANGGKMLKPHLVKQIIDSDGNIIKNFDLQEIKQIVSSDTCKTIAEILETVVSTGGGKNAYVAGFKIAGKTGTSEKLPRGSKKYISSFIGFAPADNPEISILITLDEPMGEQYYGGVIAAPVAGGILDETLKYLGVEPRYTEEELKKTNVSVPDLVGLTVNEAKRAAEAIGVNVVLQGSGVLVIEQIPKPYMSFERGSSIIAYTNYENGKTKVVVPNVVGMNMQDAKKNLIDSGLNIKISESFNKNIGVCSFQSIEGGVHVETGSVVVIEFERLDKSACGNW